MSEGNGVTANPWIVEDDTINRLAGITPASPLGHLRAQRPDIIRHAEGSYRALLDPVDPGKVSLVERNLIALRVALLTGSTRLAEWHSARLLGSGVDEAVVAAAGDLDSPLLTPRERVILRHVDLLATAPATATAIDIAYLTAAGLEPQEIVTISQLIAFLSFQVRTLFGLQFLVKQA